MIHKDGIYAPKDAHKALRYFLLAADEGDMDAIYEASTWHSNSNYSNQNSTTIELIEKYKYQTTYYCKKYIKLSETKDFNWFKKRYLCLMLKTYLSRFCRVCSNSNISDGEPYMCCSKCKSVYYCSVKCEKDDWKNRGHKEECKRLL